MRIVRYFLVGGAAAAVDISLYALFAVALGYPYLIVAGCTFLVATAVNYALSVRHVFESGIRFAKREEVALVFLVSGIGLLINQFALYVFVEYLDLNLVLAKVLATALVFFWNYLLRAHIIFSKGRPSGFPERKETTE